MTVLGTLQNFELFLVGVQDNNLIFILSSAPLKSLMRIAVDLKRTFEELAG